MANPNPNLENLKPFPKGVSGNPAGTKPGTIHLSTHIQNALNDPDFELKLRDGSILKEMPIKAIIKTAIAKSVGGDTRAMEWLAKHGYGEKINLVVDDPREKILNRYMENADVGEAGEAKSRSPQDTA